MTAPLFGTIAGHERLKDHFARLLREGGLGHAYLFAGREGLAKTAFALELAVAVVCGCGNCGACDECARARRGLHPDLHVLEREGDVIRVEQVEPLLADLSLKPFTSERRVWVIPEAETLHPAAANKLLKSIEEPPPDVHFVLVSDHLERVLATIVSRCQLVEFQPLSDVELEDYLTSAYGLDTMTTTALTRLAAGSVERADRLAQDAQGAGRRAAYLAQATALFAGRRDEAARAAAAFIAVLADHKETIKTASQGALEGRTAELEQQFQEKRELKRWQDAASLRARREETRQSRMAAIDAIDILTSWVRDLWVVACGAPDVLCNCDRQAELEGTAVAAAEYYSRLLAELAQTRKDLYLNVSHELALKAMFARCEEVVEGA